MASNQIFAAGYYRNEELFKENVPEADQMRAQKAYELGQRLLVEAKASLMKDKVYEPTYHSNLKIVLFDPFYNPWFWHTPHYYYSPHFSYSHSSGCGSCGSGGGCGDCKGDGCAIVVLVIALVAFVAAAAIAIGFTAYQGYEAEKVRDQLSDLKKEIKEAEKDKQTQEVFNKVAAIYREEWGEKTAKVVFSASITAGFVILAVATVMALYAVSRHTPVPPLAKTLASAGGAITAAGITGHILKSVVKRARKSALDQKYEDLKIAMEALKYVPLPFQALKDSNVQNGYLTHQGAIYLKIGDSYGQRKSTEIDTEKLKKEGFQKVDIEYKIVAPSPIGTQ